jgi:group I intron endonuclease
MNKNIIIGIYKITSPSGKIYIGQSVNIHRRWREYKYPKKEYYDYKIYNSFKKYGYENHIFQIICECTEKELNDKEIFYGKLFDVTGKNGLNIRECGGSKGNLNHETKEKISKKAIIRLSNPENNPFYRKHHSEETKELLSKININNPRNEDAIKKAVLKNTGKKRTSEFKKNRSGEKNPMYNKKHTEESKKLQSENIKDSWKKRKNEGRNKQNNDHILKRVESTRITKELIREERAMMIF